MAFLMNKRKWGKREAGLCYAESFSNLLFLSWYRRNRGASLETERLVVFTFKKCGNVGFQHDSNIFYVSCSLIYF